MPRLQDAVPRWIDLAVERAVVRRDLDHLIASSVVAIKPRTGNFDKNGPTK